MSSLTTSVDVNVPAEVAFEQLINYEEFPAFMEGVQEVRATDGTHLHWRSVSTAGALREWDSEITEHIPGKLIAWRNLNDHKNTGQLMLDALADGQTRVTMSMAYELKCPAGQEHVAESDTEHRAAGDLQRFKALVEGKMRGNVGGTA